MPPTTRLTLVAARAARGSPGPRAAGARVQRAQAPAQAPQLCRQHGGRARRPAAGAPLGVGGADTGAGARTGAGSTAAVCIPQRGRVGGAAVQAVQQRVQALVVWRARAAEAAGHGPGCRQRSVRKRAACVHASRWVGTARVDAGANARRAIAWEASRVSPGSAAPCRRAARRVWSRRRSTAASCLRSSDTSLSQPSASSARLVPRTARSASGAVGPLVSTDRGHMPYVGHVAGRCGARRQVEHSTCVVHNSVTRLASQHPDCSSACTPPGLCVQRAGCAHRCSSARMRCRSHVRAASSSLQRCACSPLAWACSVSRSACAASSRASCPPQQTE